MSDATKRRYSTALRTVSGEHKRGKMPVSESQAQEMARLKDEFVEYYRELPVKRYAAGYVGKSEDTIARWLQEDTEFAERVTKAKSDWAKARAKKTMPAFQLERLDKEIWAERKEVTGKDGEPVIPILGGISRVSDNDSNPKDSEPQKED